MADTPIHLQAFRDLGGNILTIHYDYKFLVEFFKPYIIGDLILYKNRYMGVLNPYLMTTFVHKLLRDIRFKIDAHYSRASKFNVYPVSHDYGNKFYTQLPYEISLELNSPNMLRGLHDKLYLELFIRTLDKNGDTYNDITITDTMSTR